MPGQRPAYSSNLLPAGTPEDLLDRTIPFFKQVRERLGWSRLGLDLHLGGRLIGILTHDPRMVQQLRSALDAGGLSVEGINAFPLGAFQEGPVKERAYQPDWTCAERRDLTLACIPLALALSDEPVVAISTVPGSFKPWQQPSRPMARNLVAWAEAAAGTYAATGRQVVLCLEPEPQCSLETTAEAIAFWQGPLAEAAPAPDVARHLGLCLDACHLACAYEDDPIAGFKSLTTAGICVAKVHLSVCPIWRGGPLQPLLALAEPRFLHQTALRLTDGRLERLTDLPDLAGWPGDPAQLQEIRSHFHLPLHLPPPPGLHRSPGLPALLTYLRNLSQGHPDDLGTAGSGLAGMCQAIETYTWPIRAAGEALVEGVAAELAWCEQQV